MESRITRRKASLLKVEQEIPNNSSFAENSHGTEDSNMNTVNNDDTSDCSDIVTESGDAGELIPADNQNNQVDDNNIKTPSPLKTTSPLKRAAEIEFEDFKHEQNLNKSSPEKQPKVESNNLNAYTPMNGDDSNRKEDTDEFDHFVDASGSKEDDKNLDQGEKCEVDDDQTEYVNDDDDDSDREATAEEIVQKLCKNGKVLTLTEGEKYFKVIVYEDSSETKDDTLEQQNSGYEENNCQQSLLQKIVDGDFDDEESTPTENQHVLADRTNIINNNATGVTQPVIPAQLISSISPKVAESTTQWYTDVCLPSGGYSHTSPAAAIQSNFTQTMSRFAPAFLSTNIQESHETNMTFNNNENLPQFIEPAGEVSTTSQRLFCTPHPKNGQYMFYYSDAAGNQTQANFIPFSSSTPLGRPKQRGASKSKPRTTNTITLNSSGEENQSPPDQPPVTKSTPVDKKTKAKVISRTLDDTDIEFMGEEGSLREQHNQKERRRRARIKEACDLMRQLVPGMSEKTDKATVFEFGARYIHFLKSFIGTEHDKDFLMKYSPY